MVSCLFKREWNADDTDEADLHGIRYKGITSETLHYCSKKHILHPTTTTEWLHIGSETAPRF